MPHTLTVNAASLAEALKDAALYVGKEHWKDALNSVMLSVVSRSNRLTVVGCDGRGYYERRITLVRGRGIPKPSLPGARGTVCIAVRDVAKLTKLINSRTEGRLTLEIDAQDKEETHKAKLMLADGSSTTFMVETYSDIPDFTSLVAQAEAGLAQPPKLTNVYIPVAEMLRAGKVFPGKNGATARICASKRDDRSGCLSLLEYQDKDSDLDIRVIFMLTEPEADPNVNSNAQAKAA